MAKLCDNSLRVLMSYRILVMPDSFFSLDSVKKSPAVLGLKLDPRRLTKHVT